MTQHDQPDQPDVLARLRALQAGDLPVHGGRTLAYVYDSGLPDVDRVGREAVAAYAGCQVFPLAMLPDAAAVDARRTGSNRAGVYTGVWTAGETLGLALGPGLFALVLTLGGYRSSTDGDVAQPDSALTAIVVGFSLLPAALTLLSLLWLRRYSLDATEVDA